MLDTLTSCCGMFLLFVFTFAIAFVYQFIVRLWQYFSERNVRYVRGLPVLGSAYKSVLGIEPAAVAYRRCYDQFPTQKLMGIYEFGGRPSYLIRNPDLIKQLMITDADHFSDNKLTFENDLLGHTSFGLQKSTNALSSALTGNKLRLMHSLMVKASEKFVNTVKDTDKTAKIFNCRHLFGRYATDTIAASALGIELNSLHDTNNDLFMAGRKLSEFNHFNALKFLANSSFPTAVKLVNAFVTEETHAKMLKKIAKDSIETRKEKKSSETILIDFLIKARDGQASDDGGDDKTNIGFSIPTEQLNINKLSEEIKSESGFFSSELFFRHFRFFTRFHNLSTYIFRMSEKLRFFHFFYFQALFSKIWLETQNQLIKFSIFYLQNLFTEWTDDDIVVQCAKFFLSELNSISTIASFMFHELALNPDIQDKLFAEIDSVKRELNGSPLTYEVIPKLKYLDMVMKKIIWISK